jgi:hypothetical protein
LFCGANTSTEDRSGRSVKQLAGKNQRVMIFVIQAELRRRSR